MAGPQEQLPLAIVFARGPHLPLQPQPWSSVSVSRTPPPRLCSTGSSHSPHPQAAPLASPSWPEHPAPGHPHPAAQKLCLPEPVSSSRLLSELLGPWQRLPAAPCAALSVPAACAASCESAFSSLPAKVKPSPPAWPQCTSGCRAPTLQPGPGDGVGICAGGAGTHPTRPSRGEGGAQGPRDEIQEGKQGRQTPERSSRFATRD